MARTNRCNPQTLDSYDQDVTKTVDYLLTHPNCNGRIGSTGMCLGGHLALRAGVSPLPQAPIPIPAPCTLHPAPSTQTNTPQLDSRISAIVAYFATDVHTRTLGPHPKNTSPTAEASSPHTLDNLHRISAEVAMLFGIKDTHVPDAGRDLIRLKLREAGVVNSFHEFAWAQHAFIRDELSKGRYDPVITKVCFEILLELFGRVLKTEVGERDVKPEKVEHVC